jgi:FkbM family methyltransferase
MPNLVDHLLRALGRAGAPGAHRLVNALRPAGRMAGERFLTRFDGLAYEGSLGEYIDREIFYFGAYAPAELDLLAQAATALAPDGGLNFYDIGANVGQHSLWMSRRAARVFAFEPSARAVAQFRENLTRNAIENVTVFPFALGEESGTARLGSGFANNSGSRSLTWTLDETDVETVELRRGDTVFREQALPTMHLLKLDVEGYEKRVLSNLHERLCADRPVIMMELIGQSEKSGFADEADLRATLYPDHALFSMVAGRVGRLSSFDWNVDEMVCVPLEKVGLMRPLVR